MITIFEPYHDYGDDDYAVYNLWINGDTAYRGLSYDGTFAQMKHHAKRNGLTEFYINGWDTASLYVKNGDDYKFKKRLTEQETNVLIQSHYTNLW